MTQRSKVVELYKTVSMSLPDGDYQLGFPMSDMKTIAINQFLHNKILNFIVMTQQGLWVNRFNSCNLPSTACCTILCITLISDNQLKI